MKQMLESQKIASDAEALSAVLQWLMRIYDYRIYPRISRKIYDKILT